MKRNNETLKQATRQQTYITRRHNYSDKTQHNTERIASTAHLTVLIGSHKWAVWPGIMYSII